MTEERRVQLVAEVDTTQTQHGFQQIGQQAESMAQRVGAAGERAETAVEQIGVGAQRSAQQVEAAQRNLINSIQRTSAAMESGSRTSAQYFETLARQRGVDTGALQPYLEQLRAIEAAQATANNAQRAGAQSLQLVGQSAAQTAAALRQVPAQLTDIVVGLQGGQRPLTVLLQQGGQLRDMFGSVGNVFRALGSTIAGLITPMTVLAGAAAALALAYHEGSKEADAYNKALITTGNVAGTTADQLSDMARAIRSGTQFTQGAASEALAALVQTGQVPAEQLQQFATVALKVQRSIGTSVQDTAKDFADLGKAPLQATEKLNEQLHYLTSSTYAQIKALQDLGKTSEAAAVAQNAYADALSSRSDELQSKLGLLERAWQSVASGAKSAWDSILDVGRENTLEQKLAKVQGSIRTQESLRASFLYSADSKAQLVGLREQETALQNQIQLQKTIAGIKAEQQRFNTADIAWQKEGEQFLTKRQQLERDLAKSRQQGLDAGRSDTEISAREAEIRKKYAGEFKDGIEAQIEAIKRRGEIEDTVAQRSLNALNSAREVQKAQEGLEQNRLKALQSEIAFLQASAQLEDAADARTRQRLTEQLELKKKEENSLKDQADLRGQLAALDEKALTRRLKLQGDLNKLEDLQAVKLQAELKGLASAREADAEGLKKQVQAQQQSNAEIGLSAKQTAELNAAMLEEVATRKEVEAGILDTILGREQEADAMRDSAAQYRKLAEEQRAGIFKRSDFEAQKSFWTSLEDTAHQTFTSIFDGGKNAAQRLKDTFKNVFFDWLYQMTAKKWLINVAGSLGINTGAVFGSAGAAETVGNVASAAGGGGPGSFLSAGATLFSSIKDGFAGLSETIADTVQGIQYGTGLSSSILTNNAFSNFAGAAGSALAGYGLGSTANKLISGNMQTGSTVMAAERVATLAASIFAGPLGGIVAGAISGVVNRAFGRGPKEITSQGIRGTFTGDTFTGQSFADFFQKGGWFRSDKRGTDLSPLAAEQQTAFDSAFKGIKDATSAYAQALGLSTDVITGYSKEINLTLTKDQAENEKLIADLFGGIGDEIASSLSLDLTPFQQQGEHLSATLQRVATDFTAVGAVLQGLGVDVDKALGAIGTASIAAREHLVAFAGGLDKLVSQASFFQQNFLTDAEKIAPVQQQVAAALEALGYSSVKTVAQFHDAVLALTDSGALATEAGQKAFAGLLAIAPQFKQVADYTEQAAKSAQDLAKSQAEAAATAAKAAAQSAFGVLSSAISRQKDAITNQFSGVLSSLSASIANFGAGISSTKNIIKLTRDALNAFSLPGEEAKVRENARKRLSDIAHAPSLADEATIQQAISDATQFQAEDFASAFDQRVAMLTTRNDIETINAAATKQLSSQEQSLQILQGWQAEYTADQDKQLAALDAQLTAAQAQLDALNGVNASVLSVRDAMSAFASAISAAGGGTAPGGVINAGAGSGLGLVSNAGQFGPGHTPLSAPLFWEGGEFDAFKQGLVTFFPNVAPERAPSMDNNGPVSLATLANGLSSLEQVMTTGLMTVAENTKATSDTLDQFNLQGMPTTRT